MKLFTVNMILAAVFAMPVVATAKDVKAEEAKTVAVKNQKDIKTAVDAAKALNEEEKRGKTAYRLEDMKDPNIKKSKSIGASVDVAGFKLKPKVGTTRRWGMTPNEKREEDEGKTHLNPRGSRLTRASTESRPTHIGVTVTKEFGAKQ